MPTASTSEEVTMESESTEPTLKQITTARCIGIVLAWWVLVFGFGLGFAALGGTIASSSGHAEGRPGLVIVAVSMALGAFIGTALSCVEAHRQGFTRAFTITGFIGVIVGLLSLALNLGPVTGMQVAPVVIAVTPVVAALVSRPRTLDEVNRPR